jgi:hypothetical protein
MGKSQPKSPDPVATSNAQGAQDRKTALTNMETSMVNQVTPWGGLNYAQTGTSANGNPQYTATQTLSPSGERLMGYANNLLDNVGDGLTTPLNLGSAGKYAGTAYVNKLMYGAPEYQGGQSKYFNAAIQSPVTRSAASDIPLTAQVTYDAAQRDRVEKALMDRLRPQLDTARGGMESRLAAQGLQPGTEAYDRAYGAYAQQENDALLGVIAQGGEEQARQFNMGLQNAQLGNSAQAQQFGQSYANAQLGNSVRNQLFQEGLARAGMDNTARSARYGEATSQASIANAQRADAINQMLMTRNQPLQDYAALTGQGAAGYGSYVNAPTYNQPSTDISGMIYGNYAQQMNAYNAQNQGLYGLLGQGLMGGLMFGLKP